MTLVFTDAARAITCNFRRQRDIFLTLQERRFRLTLARRLLSKDADLAAEAIAGELGGLSAKARRTITHDNGGEFARHKTVTDAIGLTAYFCDPHSPCSSAPSRTKCLGCRTPIEAFAANLSVALEVLIQPGSPSARISRVDAGGRQLASPGCAERVYRMRKFPGLERARLPLISASLALLAFPLAAQQDPNLQACLHGFPGCDMSRLTQEERGQVEEAAIARNLRSCMADFPGCDVTLLSAGERAQVEAAAADRNRVACLNGYPGCDPDRLGEADRTQMNANAAARGDLRRRIDALATSDPEIHRLLMSALYRNDVDGGFGFEVGTAEIDCDERYGDGFVACTVSVPVEVRSFAESPDSRDADIEVTCDAEIAFAGEAGWSSLSEEGDTSFRIGAGSRGSDRVEIDFDFPYHRRPVRQVEISDARCEIDSID